MSNKARKHELLLRNVLGLACEVWIRLLDSRVVFATVVPGWSAAAKSFVVRPWGLSRRLELRFNEVSLAKPVRGMSWERERTICASQVAAHWI